METTLAGSTVMAATSGQLLLDTDDAESAVAWLAVAKIATLEIWVDGNSGSDACKALDMANETEIDGRSIALATIPRGNGEDCLLLLMDTLTWELRYLNSQKSPQGGAYRVQMSVAASNSLGSNCCGTGSKWGGLTSREILLAVRGPSALHQTASRGLDRHLEEGSKAVVAFACKSTLQLLALSDAYEGKAKGGSIKSSQATFHLESEPLRGRVNQAPEKGSFQPSKTLQASTSSALFPRAYSGMQTLLDITLLNDKGRDNTEAGDYRYTIALLVDEVKGNRAGARRYGDRHIVVRTYQWDLACGSILSPGNWCIVHLHPDTSITPLAGGGLLCVSSDGLAAFSGKGDSLFGVESLSGQVLAGKVPKFATGSWESTQPAALTRVAYNPRKARDALGSGEQGEVEDFLVGDVDGELHHISLFDECSTGAVGSILHARQNTKKATKSLGRGNMRVECTRLEKRIGLGSARPLPRDIKLLVSVGSCGLVFAAGPSSSCPFIVRVTLASPPSCSIGRNSVRKYEELRKRGDPSAPWQTIERAERLGDSLGAVSCIVMIDNKCPRTYDVGGDWAQKASAAEYDSGLQGTATGAKETPSFELPKFPRGMRAVLATGEFTSNADGAGDLGADLCILEHGLGLDAAVEGSTGLPEGATLFVQPLISEGLSKEGHRSRNDNCTTNGAADIADEGCAQFDYVILLSDRVRSQTHVMVTSLDGETAPVGGEKGFNCDLPTVHLGRLIPSGYLVQITEQSIHFVDLAGLLEVAFWRPISSSFKIQHGATAGNIVAVICENTMVLLEFKTLFVQETGCASKKEVNELSRVELGGAGSALEMCVLEKGRGGAATTVFIGVALWERPSITVFLWPPLSARDNRAVLNQQSNSPEKIPPEIATWIPPWGLIAATEKTSSNGGDLGALRTYQNVTLTRALAFVRIEGKLGRLALVAATADGMIAVAEWQSDGKSEEGWGREGKVWGDRGKLLTLASFQVGEGPVRLEVFDGSAEKATRGNNQFEYHPNLSRGQEAVFVNGGMDAVLHRCSNTDECPDPNQGIWQCTQVCQGSHHPRRNVVNLPCGKTTRQQWDNSGNFAWLTLEEPATQYTKGKYSTNAEGHHQTGVTERSHSSSCSNAPEKESFSRLALSFGVLDWKSRARYYKKPLLFTPTHLVYAPASRSIVVVCYGNATGKVAEKNIFASSIRIFDVGTLEERPGGPLFLLPGVRITGIALLGINSPLQVSQETSARVGHVEGYEHFPTTAIGGDVIAVACCSAPVDEKCVRHRQQLQRNARDTIFSRTVAGGKDKTNPNTSSTTVAAFEVVGCGSEVNFDRSGGHGIEDSDGGENSSNGSGDCTFLASLAASSKMAGACFCLEALGSCSVAASSDDRVAVFGWTGRGDGLRPEQPTPPLTLNLVACCRTPSGGCVTALSTYGNFIAVAEFLHSVALFRFDQNSKTLSLLARHSRKRLVVTTIALSPNLSCDHEGEDDAATRFPLVALADRTTGTIAVLACRSDRFPSTIDSSGSVKGRPVVSRTYSSLNADMLSDEPEGNAIRRCAGSCGDRNINHGNDPRVASLRLMSVWPCHDTVTCLKYVRSIPPGDHRHAERVLQSGGKTETGGFVVGTASGAVKTVRFDTIFSSGHSSLP